ncbi:MAG: nitrous oxide-stimulated promoter family protein [Desulfuromonas sp.]|uniref:nitrous oxide-stimulated promoter family protein n=1 Tax=Desulfuromonas sp. TaxID=892 RepID=UPI000CC723C4|nr:nitrous oxide-stimulated promoter family protein [Desulfuromonas sp.]PLX83340.1 MAG: nitrous oxide-stimulated promoter family protein [Desulfuromonas sp.]
MALAEGEKTGTLTPKERKDLKVLALFVAVYCREHHRGEKAPLGVTEHDLEGLAPRAVCGECRDILAYAFEKRLRCPLEPKPVCKHCHIHCYRAGHREKVREIMRFSGRHLILRGRLDLLWHYFF